MRNSGTLFANDLRKDRCKAHFLKPKLVMFRVFFEAQSRKVFRVWMEYKVQWGKFGKCSVWKVMLIFGWKSMNDFGSWSVGWFHFFSDIWLLLGVMTRPLKWESLTSGWNGFEESFQIDFLRNFPLPHPSKTTTNNLLLNGCWKIKLYAFLGLPKKWGRSCFMRFLGVKIYRLN